MVANTDNLTRHAAVNCAVMKTVSGTAACSQQCTEETWLLLILSALVSGIHKAYQGYLMQMLFCGHLSNAVGCVKGCLSLAMLE